MSMNIIAFDFIVMSKIIDDDDDDGFHSHQNKRSKNTLKMQLLSQLQMFTISAHFKEKYSCWLVLCAQEEKQTNKTMEK